MLFTEVKKCQGHEEEQGKHKGNTDPIATSAGVKWGAILCYSQSVAHPGYREVGG